MKFLCGFAKWNLDLYDFQKTTIQRKVCSYVHMFLQHLGGSFNIENFKLLFWNTF